MLRSRRVPEELLDVITYELINDPVIAEDNITYSRANILDWFSQCKARSEPITSPMTRSEMGETIRPNYPVQRSLELFQSQNENTALNQEAEAPSIAQLAKVFEVIDPIRDLLASIKWQPPAIVVLGNEKSGKSSLLERLAMIPIFPKAKQICTRMAIHVRLRRGPARPPLVEVYDKVAGAVLRDMVIPMEKGNEYVNDAMERILMAENDGVIRGICNRKMLVLHVSSPSAPNLDLVDLPGLVSTFVRGEPENMQALTRELVENYIKENSTHSMYLVTVPARSATNQSLAMEVVQRYKLQSRTIGVLTKSDLYATIADDDLERSENVRELCEKVFQRSSDVCPLPTYGYVATMNKPIREGQYATNYGALMHQAEREKEWFVNMGFQEIVESGHATMGALVNRLSSVYHNYMRHTWAPLTILRLERERVAISQREQALGLPRADGFALHGQESNAEGMVSLQSIQTMATELTVQLFKAQRTVIIDRICSLILKNFQGAIRAESISKTCSPADAIDLQRQAKVQIENHCTSALDYLQKFMMNEMKVILNSDKSTFCLHRFSNLTDAVLERSAGSLDQWRQDTETTMMNYVAMAFQNLPINPYLTVKYSFEGSQPTVKFSFDSTSLSDVLPHVMVLRLSSLITDLLGSTVASVADGLSDSAWIESCASERKAMLKTVRMIETAEAELMQVLFISPADMESFIGRDGHSDGVSVASSSHMSSAVSVAGPSGNAQPPAPSVQLPAQYQPRPAGSTHANGGIDNNVSTGDRQQPQISARLGSGSVSSPSLPSAGVLEDSSRGYTPAKSQSEKAGGEMGWTTPAANSAPSGAYGSTQYGQSPSLSVPVTPPPPPDGQGPPAYNTTPVLDKKPYDPSNPTPNNTPSYTAVNTPGTQRFTNPTPNNTPSALGTSTHSSQRYPPYQSAESPYVPSSSTSSFAMSPAVPALASSASAANSSSVSSPPAMYDAASQMSKSAAPSAASPAMMRMMMDRGSNLDGSVSSAMNSGPGNSSQPGNGSGPTVGSINAPYNSSYGPQAGANPIPAQQVISSSLNKTTRFDATGPIYESSTNPSTGRYDKFEPQGMDSSQRSYASYAPPQPASNPQRVSYGSVPGSIAGSSHGPQYGQTEGGWEAPQGHNWAPSQSSVPSWSSAQAGSHMPPMGAPAGAYGSSAGQLTGTARPALPSNQTGSGGTSRPWTQLAE